MRTLLSGLVRTTRFRHYRGMTVGSIVDRRAVRIGYVVGAGVFTFVGSALALANLIPTWAEFTILVVLVLYLGPLGLAALLLLGPITLLLAPVLAPIDAASPSQYPAVDWTQVTILTLVAVGVAMLNILIVRRWRARSAQLAATGEIRTRRERLDRPLGAVLFSFAGCAFILLCFVAGAEALVAHGVDTVIPEAQADHTLLIAGLTWWPGFAIAVAGLVLWIVLLRRNRRILWWALGDFLIMVCLIVAAATANS